ncbi:hypothetical protein [Brevibacterium jeotgali]|uniref:hypothetical protein n=1 Tax=Brevibacterium jeotgali TaxID=1262550 RepID=UPI0011A57C0E|nr:hypothetical protein [Brevibacterium jeotgali]
MLDSTWADIDHLIPQRGFDAARSRAGLPSSFELHAVENLAPICGSGSRCNQTKPEDISGILGPIQTAVARAEQRAPAVRDRVRRVRSARGVEAGLVKFIASDIDDRIARLGAEYGPQILQRLYAIDPQSVDEYTSSHGVEVDFHALRTNGFDAPAPASLLVNSDGRFAFDAARRLYGVRVEEHLGEPVEAAFAEVVDQIEDEFSDRTDAYDARSTFTADRLPDLSFSLVRWGFDESAGLEMMFIVEMRALFVCSTALTDNDATLVSGQLETDTVAQAEIHLVIAGGDVSANHELTSFKFVDSSHTY